MNAANQTLTEHQREVAAQVQAHESDLPETLSRKWAEQVDSPFAGLTAAEAETVLPPEPPNEAELENALVSLRR